MDYGNWLSPKAQEVILPNPGTFRSIVSLRGSALNRLKMLFTATKQAKVPGHSLRSSTSHHLHSSAYCGSEM